MIEKWIEGATEAQLRDKLEEYTPEAQYLSPRDAETRAKLATLIRKELEQRGLT